jgi:hypothetical protein
MQYKIIHPEYSALKSREDILGGINFLMMLVSLVVIIFKYFDWKKA